MIHCDHFLCLILGVFFVGVVLGRMIHCDY